MAIIDTCGCWVSSVDCSKHLCRYHDGYETGEDAERARMVAWLRKVQATRVEERPSRLDELAFVQLNILADDIKRGAHEEKS